ncbi:MAG TPA: hypothetical protein VLA96_04080, partial [Terriglobales bacterium]|nr:hypothetical protein [Terriglobales bacterium]
MPNSVESATVTRDVATTSLRDVLAHAAQMASILALVTYLFGFVVVTRYFAILGVTGLEFFRAQYVLAGVWAVIPILFAFVFMSMGATTIDQPEQY